MVGISPASFAASAFLLIQILDHSHLSEACSVVCPPNEKICTCDDGMPKPTPDPVTGIVMQDSCGGLIHYCSVDGQCKPDENGCPADCPQVCTADYNPVCGSDSKTYSNQCHLEVAACKTRNTELIVSYEGECEQCPLCATLNSPVCGSDGTTYSSKCALDSKACRQQTELTVAYAGKCDDQCSTFCTFDYSPVCGTDGQTHSNLCALESKACRERSGLAVAYTGECTSSGRVPNLGPGALPPAWTQVDNSNDCLKKYKPSSPSDALHYEVCVPLSKPTECSQPTWWGLATALEAVPREELVSARPPPYLEIEGVKDCLDEYQSEESSHKEACLPTKRPKTLCNPDSWDRLVQVWEGIQCPETDTLLLGGNRLSRPKYLSVPGHELCIFDQKSGSFQSKCKPSYKPRLCTFEAWSQIKKTNLPTCSHTPRIITSLGFVAPPYLSIEGHEKCLDAHSNGQYNVKCLPANRPSNCSADIWDRVKDTFVGIPCPKSVNLLGVGGLPPAYLGIDGYQNCLENFEASASHRELCLPASRPNNCIPDSWKQLKLDGKFTGIRCPLTGIPPMYLSIDGYKKCLSVYQASSTSKGLCMPASRPRRCREKAWQQLQDYYHGVKCPQINVGAPEYLSVDGHKECLGENHGDDYSSVCLPKVKPSSCQEDAYDKLSSLSDSLPGCEPKPALTGIPPAYLSIDGHEDCLGTKTNDIGGQEEVCLPRDRPLNCSSLAWIGLQDKFEGEICKPLLGGLGALPPLYLSVAGHKNCLSHQAFIGGSHNEKCLPNSKPDVCSQEAWKALTDDGKFTGRRCRPTQIIGISAPLYTQVPGYDKCLGTVQVLGGTHEEFCLPSTKPFSCDTAVWNKLQQVFIGNDCRSAPELEISSSSSGSIVLLGGESSLPPKYLSIEGHRNCLSSHPLREASHSEICLPRIQPSTCDDDAWNGLNAQVGSGDLKQCQPSVASLGGARALPPKYLSINGHQDCLDEHSPRGVSHTEICLPNVKPVSCNSNAWNELENEVEDGRIDKCQPRMLGSGVVQALPSKYLSIDGHQDCLEEHSPRGATHTEICLPGTKPSSCNADAWELLSKEVANGKIHSCQPMLVGGLGSLPPTYLSINGHQDCLEEHSPRGASHTEICLPGAKPSTCNTDAWELLNKEVDNGKIDSCQPMLIGGLGSLPPKYLSISGHQQCLESHSPRAGATHTEICLPSSRPASCIEDSWDQLKEEVYGGRIEKCRQTIQSVGGQFGLPPAYLAIDGHKKCLSSHSTSPGASHNEICVPKSKPSGCVTDAWEALNTLVDQGDLSLCRMPSLGGAPMMLGGPSSLPPKYLGVEGWNDCAREYEASDSHTAHCLPLSQPSAPCKSQAYQELLQITFQVEGIDSRSVGILDAQPPEYLFVAGHENCLDDITVGDHKERCLPSNRPNGCSSSTWIQLQNVFEGKPCKACQKYCTRDYYPVCGSDGTTYPNKCTLEYTGCKEEREVTLRSFGKCCPEICIEIYEPVCGSDGKTYSNTCYFERAVCSSNGDVLKVAHDGECKTTDLGTQQEGEVCGSCFNPDKNFDCGKCVEGLECVEDPRSSLLPDLPSKCKVTLVALRGTKQEGEECGPCFNPSINFDCGSCEPGLECKEASESAILPDATATCQLISPPLPQIEPITIYRTNCAGASCGDECVDDSRGGFKGICDGQGACVSPIENPCSVHGCGGKQCGERCLEGDIAGFCDSQGACNFDMRADLCIDSAFNTDLPGLKKLGESCGSSRSEICGLCDEGLECNAPFDACGQCVKSLIKPTKSCYDKCLEEGKGGRQCAAECANGDGEGLILPPYHELTYCNRGQDDGESYCREQTGNEFTFCHKLFGIASCSMSGQKEEDCYGICIPQNVSCSSDIECKSIGSLHSGKVSSFCKNGICTYDMGMIIS